MWAGIRTAVAEVGVESSKRILITSPEYARHTPDALALLQDSGYELCWASTAFNHEQFLSLVHGCCAAIVYSSRDRFTGEVLARAPSLTVLSRHGVGYDNIDVPCATRLGIAVAITRGAGEEVAVAEHALALMMALAKRLLYYHGTVVSGGWERATSLLLSGTVLGIVGLGRVGKEVARRARALGMEILAYDCEPDEDFAVAASVQFVDLPTLLARSDFVSLHVPGGQGVIIDHKALRIMKPGAILINTARGRLVDEEAVAFALREGRLGGAGLDVFEEEPPRDSPLLSAPNTVLTPHVAAYTREVLRNMDLLAARNVVEILQGRIPPQVINPEFVRYRRGG